VKTHRPRFILALLLLPLALSSAAATDLDRIRALFTRGELDSIPMLLEPALAQARAARDTVRLIDLLTLSGAYHRRTGTPAGGLPVLREALDLIAAHGDSTLDCAPRRWLAANLSALGRNEEARLEFEHLLSVARAAGDAEHEGWAHVGLGWDADIRRDDRKALDHYTRAAEAFHRAGEAEAELWAGIGQANARFHMTEYDAAGETYRHVVEVARRAGLQRHQAISLNNLASLQFALGRPDLSLVYYERAVALWDSLGQPMERIPPSLNRGSCLLYLGREDEARRLIEAELETCRERGFRDYEARALRRLADLAESMNRPGAAIERYREVLAMGEDLSSLERADAQIGLARLLNGEGRSAEALAVLREQEGEFEQDLTSAVRMRLNLEFGRVLLRLRRSEEAHARLRQAEELLGDARARHGLEIAQLLADVYRARGRGDSVMVQLEAAVGLWEEERGLPLDPDWREERGAAGRQLFTRLAAELIDRGGAPEAFDRLQAYKARTLRERMVGPGGQAVVDDSLALTLSELQERVLAGNEIFLDAYVGPDRSLLFAVTRDRCHVETLPAASTLSPRLQMLHGLLSHPDHAGTSELDSVMARLSQDLLGAIPTLVPPDGCVVFAPDGALNLLPLGYLLDLAGSPATCTRVPSGTILRDLRRTERTAPMGAPPRLLALAGACDAYGAPLRGAAEEVNALKRAYEDVSKRRFPDNGPPPDETLLAGPEVLHIAAHVQGDDRNAWQSAIVLAPDDPALRLRAADLADMRLRARLAVLSSCSSARGRILSGEGVLGLSSAFLAAGVPAVIATLWPVQDEVTARFMMLFYRQLAEGASAGSALRRAQEKLRGETATEHAFYWSGFVLIGDGGVRIPLRPRTSPIRWLMIVGLGGLLGVWIVWRIRRSGP